VTTIAEVSESLVTNRAYRALAIQKPVPVMSSDFSITVNVRYPSAPTTPRWAVQGAINNVDAEFVTIFSGSAAGTFSDSGSFASTGQSSELWPGAWNFIRFKDDGSAGGSSPTVVAKIIVS
jgi:hypothetical protein